MRSPPGSSGVRRRARNFSKYRTREHPQLRCKITFCPVKDSLVTGPTFSTCPYPVRLSAAQTDRSFVQLQLQEVFCEFGGLGHILPGLDATWPGCVRRRRPCRDSPNATSCRNIAINKGHCANSHIIPDRNAPLYHRLWPDIDPRTDPCRGVLDGLGTSGTNTFYSIMGVYLYTRADIHIVSNRQVAQPIKYYVRPNPAVSSCRDIAENKYIVIARCALAEAI